MELTLIRINSVDDGFEWTTVRKGEIIANGIEKDLLTAKIISEQTILTKYSAEKIINKILMGQGSNQLFLLSSTK